MNMNSKRKGKPPQMKKSEIEHPPKSKDMVASLTPISPPSE
jgi:hypothetical protein